MPEGPRIAIEESTLPGESVRSRLPPIPGPLGRKVLAFEFVVLLEYWLAPLFLGVTNYAGVWSDIGTLLFLLFTASVIVLVLVPLRPHLAPALRPRRNRAVFHSMWVGSFVVGLFVTNIIQFVDGPTSGPILLGQTTVYSPFGAWTSLTIYLPSLRMWATFNPEGPGVLFLLSMLGASTVVLGPLQHPRICPVPGRGSRTWRSRITSLGVLAPLGFISGCPGCSPVYFAALALVAPGTAEGASQAIPLVPWIGFAGLLYLLGFWFATRLIHRATSTEIDPVVSASSE